jgi:hypothetical protein
VRVCAGAQTSRSRADEIVPRPYRARPTGRRQSDAEPFSLLDSGAAGASTG